MYPEVNQHNTSILQSNRSQLSPFVHIRPVSFLLIAHAPSQFLT
jgi:hypothetical protein